ncbi:Crp/Fnr family transcriptional regulator [Pantoea sp. 18069]|uniref:Crp/Fnr family transcriptional regulator n=1 Tax=Pantoea sp. 18069 TaxID=2681415 RepID=UPI0013595768|nr:Crp/Fnr family transcriptional regulator [Pantoea sp. 18069]
MLPLSRIDAFSPVERRSAGALLRARATRCEDVLYLDSGRVALGIREAQGGLRHRLGMVQGPAWLDAAFVLRGRHCSLDMVAEGAVQLRRVALGTFEAGLQGLPPLLRGLVDDMARAYCEQTDLAISRLLQDAEGRCAQWLLQHAQVAPGGGLQVLLGERKRLIAAQLGIAPETFSRALRRLRDQGLIAGKGNQLKLPQPEGLRELAGHFP